MVKFSYRYYVRIFSEVVEEVQKYFKVPIDKNSYFKKI